MTKKQLESIIVLVCMYEDKRFSVEEINKKFGLSITEQTSRQEVVSEFLKLNNITLESEQAKVVECSHLHRTPHFSDVFGYHEQCLDCRRYL